jgi:hypothetical protein
MQKFDIFLSSKIVEKIINEPVFLKNTKFAENCILWNTKIIEICILRNTNSTFPPQQALLFAITVCVRNIGYSKM